ncbi:MAG: type I methionyl aminopeptidase [Candidatus Doudnabacteria bacterium]|nr:type I methionyl aminopeptidase [Candidatus Doudnabacteria bacterium]
MVNHYSNLEIAKINQSGKILSRVLREVVRAAKPGISTYALDRLARKKIAAAGALPAFLGYQTHGSPPYPAALCVSVNEELVHCIPKKAKIVKPGDIVSLDLGVNYGGFFSDMAVTVPVGSVSSLAQRLIQATAAGLEEAIMIIKPGATLGDLGAAIQHAAASKGFAVVRDLVGHGVGKTVHEDPKVPNYGTQGTGLRLTPGMVLAIEPMFTAGSHKIQMLADRWGIATADGSLCAHFEKTVAVTQMGHKVLTPDF